MTETKTFEDLSFKTMTREDIPQLTAVMKASFDDDSRLYFNRPAGGPPGYDDGSSLTKWGIESGAEAWCIYFEDKLVGGLIVFLHKDGVSGFLGTIFIDPEYIGKGIGTKVWRFVEASHPNIKVWNTETPAVSYRNHCYYVNKCGFHIVKVDGGRDKYEGMFQLEKRM